MTRRLSAAFRRCLALSVIGGLCGGSVYAAGNETEASLLLAARRHEQRAEDIPGVEDSHSELGVFQARILQKSQIEAFSLGIAASGDGGRSQDGADRYLAGTIMPLLAYEGPRQTHHFSLALTRSYDSQGMVRLSLREQVDAAGLTDEQKKRFTQAGVNTDHYFSLDQRHALVLFLSGSSLDREIITKTYVAGGFVQREMSPLWKLRLGGSALRVLYDGAELKASGPEVQSLHEWSEAWLLTLKAGMRKFKSDSGESNTQTGGATLDYKRADDRATLGFERSTGGKAVTAEVTTSDVSSARGRLGLSPEAAVEASVEQRLERWLSGADEGARAETQLVSLGFVVGWGGRSPWKDGRSRFNATFAFEREDLRVKSGIEAERQSVTAGLERAF